VVILRPQKLGLLKENVCVGEYSSLTRGDGVEVQGILAKSSHFAPVQYHSLWLLKI
jgi:hypothetical protein